MEDDKVKSLLVVLSIILLSHSFLCVGFSAAAEIGKKNSNVQAKKKVVKADTVEIYYADHSYSAGKFTDKIGAGGTLEHAANNEFVTVVIIRGVSPENAKKAKKMGVKVGGAYLREDGDDGYKFKYIKTVNLKLSDKKLAALFGVETGPAEDEE